MMSSQTVFSYVPFLSLILSLLQILSVRSAAFCSFCKAFRNALPHLTLLLGSSSSSLCVLLSCARALCFLFQTTGTVTSRTRDDVIRRFENLCAIARKAQKSLNGGPQLDSFPSLALEISELVKTGKQRTSSAAAAAAAAAVGGGQPGAYPVAMLPSGAAGVNGVGLLDPKDAMNHEQRFQDISHRLQNLPAAQMKGDEMDGGNGGGGGGGHSPSSGPSPSPVAGSASAAAAAAVAAAAMAPHLAHPTGPASAPASAAAAAAVAAAAAAAAASRMA